MVSTDNFALQNLQATKQKRLCIYV